MVDRLSRAGPPPDCVPEACFRASRQPLASGLPGVLLSLLLSLLLPLQVRAELWEPDLVAQAMAEDPSVSIYLDDFTSDGCLTNQAAVRARLASRLSTVFATVEQGGGSALHYSLSVHGAAVAPGAGLEEPMCSLAVSVSYQAWLPVDIGGRRHQALIAIGPSKLYSGLFPNLDDVVMEAALYTVDRFVADIRALDIP